MIQMKKLVQPGNQRGGLSRRDSPYNPYHSQLNGQQSENKHIDVAAPDCHIVPPTTLQADQVLKSPTHIPTGKLRLISRYIA